MLNGQIAEWQEAVVDARRALAEAATRRNGGVVTVEEDDAGLELDLAGADLAALEEAERLLQSVVAQLDVPGRATVALAARLLYEVDPCRPDALAGETARLRDARLRMPAVAN